MHKLPVLAALAALLGTPAALAQQDWKAPRVVTWVCSGCHGIDGNAQLPDVPRLAGRNAGYLLRQMTAFAAAPAPSSIEISAWIAAPAPLPANARGGALARRYMIGPAHAATEAEAKAAVDLYAARKPAPAARAADTALLERGRALYTQGKPAAGVVACQDCHGAAGRGIADFPALAGQNAAYLERQLQGFVDGHRPLGVTMHGIAHGLTPEDRRALALYAQSL
ncbi:MAG: c-type cytochrome [Burkholderiales bacterium]|jgi:cytochrome c553|nr:c-type cytochrome [Burkholderiales bacterium]